MVESRKFLKNCIRYDVKRARPNFIIEDLPHSTPRSGRKYQLCNTLKDEFHFMLEYPLYRELRVRYIRKRINMHKLIELFKSENTIVVKI